MTQNLERTFSPVEAEGIRPVCIRELSTARVDPRPYIQDMGADSTARMGAVETYPHSPQPLLRILNPLTLYKDGDNDDLSTRPKRGQQSRVLVLAPKYLYNSYKEPCPHRSLQGRINMDMIKVSANSRTSAVAGAIAGVVREHKRAEVQAIGAGAVNQAVKALVLARGYLEGDGINIVCIPEFVDVDIDDKVRTAIKIVVEPR